MSRYDDIINSPRHISIKHPHMEKGARAAQFAPFAALTGFEEKIDEAARLTDARPVLSQDEINRLNEILEEVRGRIADKPEVEIEYFIPDERKEGGAFKTVFGRLRLIDTVHRLLILDDGRKIPSDMVTDLKAR